MAAPPGWQDKRSCLRPAAWSCSENLSDDFDACRKTEISLQLPPAMQQEMAARSRCNVGNQTLSALQHQDLLGKRRLPRNAGSGQLERMLRQMQAAGAGAGIVQ